MSPANHDGFGYTNEPYPHYACFCGFPVSRPTHPISGSPENLSFAPSVLSMKRAWLAHKHQVTGRNN